MLPYHILGYLPDDAALTEVTTHLDAGGDPRAHDNAALRWACHSGHLDVVERLISLGLTAADARVYNNTALRWVCRRGYLDLVERLLSLGLTAADAREDNNHALRWACANGHLAVVERLLSLGLTAADAREYDNYALRMACTNGHLYVVARLLELGVEPTLDALVLCGAGRQDDDDDEWPHRLWRAVERWEGSQELAAAEIILTPAQHEAWETAKDLARPGRLRFAD